MDCTPLANTWPKRLNGLKSPTSTERRVGRNRLATSFSVCRLLTVMSFHFSFASTSWRKPWFSSSFKTHYINLHHTARSTLKTIFLFTVNGTVNECHHKPGGMTKRLVSQSPRDRPWKWSRWWCCRCPVWKSPAHGRWSKPGRSCKIGWVSFWRGWSTSGAVFWYAQVFPRLHPETCCHICNNWIVGSYYIWHCASKCAFIACIHT